jgi:hypothetical protein
MIWWLTSFMATYFFKWQHKFLGKTWIWPYLKVIGLPYLKLDYATTTYQKGKKSIYGCTIDLNNINKKYTYPDFKAGFLFDEKTSELCLVVLLLPGGSQFSGKTVVIFFPFSFLLPAWDLLFVLRPRAEVLHYYFLFNTLSLSLKKLRYYLPKSVRKN